VVDQLGQCGFTVHPLAVHEQSHGGARLQLIELDGLIRHEDPSLATFHEKMGEGLYRVAILGAYPKPLTASQGETSA